MDYWIFQVLTHFNCIPFFPNVLWLEASYTLQLQSGHENHTCNFNVFALFQMYLIKMSIASFIVQMPSIPWSDRGHAQTCVGYRIFFSAP